ncbi:MAG: prolyl oligopeptidase family serine peptidase [Planctomycetes bacterium]|nr:prolyl oligopeptidase family serine peptidase [Planctomycetota bacterium]
MMGAWNQAGANEKEIAEKMEARVHRDADGKTLPYRLFVPPEYDKTQKHALVLFLHGAGERGDDNRRQLVHPQVLRLVSEEARKKTPCILVAPQCPREDKWVPSYWGLQKSDAAARRPSEAMRLTLEVLDGLEKEFNIDPDRRYVTGLSMGGFGSFDACLRRPDYFAAAVPICGGADSSRAKEIAHIAFWVFHGGSDNVVPPGLSRAMVEALKEAGGKPKYTEYEGVGHNSWSRAYTEPTFVEWVFSQKRKAK